MHAVDIDANIIRCVITKFSSEATSRLIFLLLNPLGPVFRYQKPELADNLLKMRRELVETTQIMHGNMNALLERGDKVENLVRKSDVLAESGKVCLHQEDPCSPFIFL